MRKTNLQAALLAAAALLSGCGDRELDAPAASAAVQAAADDAGTRRIFLGTESHAEAEILRAAGARAQRGIPLDAVAAERCLEAETRRPAVQAACVLLWSMGGESSSRIQDQLLARLRGGGIERPWALAIARRPGFAEKLGLGELYALLEAFAKDPSWLRGRLARAWLSANSPSFLDGSRLWDKVAPPTGPVGPADMREAYAVAVSLGNSRWHSVLAEYCRPGVEGPARSRCWRLLSAIVNPRTGEDLEARYLPYLPRRGDAGWSLFEASFPERALLLKRYL